MIEILTDNWLDNFFKVVDEENVIKRRESHCIEFKSKFDWNIEKSRSGYCKSLAAFSNNKGGAIFFGVENRPHKIIGINNFETIDDADITNYINELFTPSIHFERKTYTFKGLHIGIIYAFKGNSRPIICNKDSSKTHSSDVYFRYGAKSTKIKAGDFLKLIEDVKEQESNKWMNLLENIGKVGVGNAHLLNTANGEILSENNTFLLDEKLLEQIKIVDRYSIQEEGQPAVRIIGQIPELTKVIKRSISIYEEDIYKSYLKDEKELLPKELLKFICQKNTSYYPFYYLLIRMKLSKKESIYLLSDIKIRGRVRIELIGRLKKDTKSIHYIKRYTLSETSTYGSSRRTILQKIQDKESIEMKNQEDAKLILESVFSLEKGEFEPQYAKDILYRIFEQFYPFTKSTSNYLFRDAISFLDYLENSY